MIFSLFDRVEYNGKTSIDIFRNINNYHRQIIGNFETIHYQIKGDLRPEQLAYELYGDSSLYWLIMLLNNKVDPYHDWLLPNEAVIGSAIYRYRWIGGVDQVDHFVDESGRWWYDVIEDPDNPRQWYNRFDFINNAPEESQEDHRQLLYSGVMIPISVEEHVFNVNERNRTIEILKPDDVGTYVSNFLRAAEA